GLDQRLRRADRLALAHARDHGVQAVEAALQQRHVAAAQVEALSGDRLQQRFHGVAELADGEHAGHARAALDGVQVALQAGQRLAVVGGLAQARQQAVRVIEQVAAFLHEDLDQLPVEAGEIELGVRVGLQRDGFQQLPARRGHGIGLGPPGGFEALGLEAFGLEAFGFEAFGFEAFGFEAFGFEALGFEALGFEALGVPAVGFGALGVDALGFGPLGCDARGVEPIGFEAFGFEAFGVQAFGFAAFGFEAFGLEAFGFEALGFEAFGFEAFGFEAFGFEAFGFGTLGFGTLGFGALGF